MFKQKAKCIICGAEVDGGKLYCEKHQGEFEKINAVIANASEETLFALIEGIFRLARVDYLLNRDGKRADAERFFRSEWAQLLSLGGFDPDKVIAIMDEEIENGLDRATVYPGREEW